MNPEIQSLAQALAGAIDLSQFKGELVLLKLVETTVGPVDIHDSTIHHLSLADPSTSAPASPARASSHQLLNAETLRPYIDAGLLTADLQPAATLSNGEKSILAHDIAERLNLRKFWRIFEDLWGVSSLRTYYSKFSSTTKAATILRRLSRLR